MVGITDEYESFCLNETADYVYSKLLEESRIKNQGSSKHNKNKLSGNEFLQSLATNKKK